MKMMSSSRSSKNRFNIREILRLGLVGLMNSQSSLLKTQRHCHYRPTINNPWTMIYQNKKRVRMLSSSCHST